MALFVCLLREIGVIFINDCLGIGVLGGMTNDENQ